MYVIVPFFILEASLPAPTRFQTLHLFLPRETPDMAAPQ